MPAIRTPTRKSWTLMGIAKAVVALAVTTAAAVYLVQALHASWSAFARIIAHPASLVAAGWLSIAYGACLFILFGAWYMTLRGNASHRVPVARGAFIYCVANIAKYLPGNVFHFAGRQVLGARAGWAHRAIAQATLLEIVATVASIVLIVFIAAAFGPSGTIESLLPETWRAAVNYEQAAGFSGIAVAAVTFLLLARLGLFGRLFGVSAAAAARAVAMCMAFFCVYAGMTAIFALHLPSYPDGPSVLTIGLAYLIAWLAGFVVPGAPGGLGVRESMLVLLLSNTGESASAIALGLGFGMRFVSTLGDVIAVGIAYGLDRLAIERNPEKYRETECA